MSGLGFWQVVRLLGVYVLNLLRFALRRSDLRFLPLTPGFMRAQVIYDRKRGNFFRLWLRDGLDLVTFGELFQREDYSTARFARHYESQAYYREALELGKVPLIIDCGAHAGFASVYFSQLFPEALIVALEPNTENFQQAKRNTQGRNVMLLNSAIGPQTGVGVLRDPGQGNNAYRIELDDAGDVGVVSISTVLEQYPSPTHFPTIVKIDIEGFEKDLFSANTEWLGEFPLLIIELHDWMLIGSANSQNFLKVMAESGRDFAYYGENVFSFRNPRKPSKRDLEGKTS